VAGLLDRKYRYLQKQENLDYSKGYNSYFANDVVPENMLVYASDTRISTLGRQKTRQGCDFYSVPAGETVNAQQTSVTGATDQNIGVTAWLGAQFTTSATGRLTRVDLNLKNAASATGPIIVEIHADAAGSPGALLAQSSIPAATPTGSYGFLTARFIEAPLLANATAYWIVCYVQSNGTNNYAWSSTTNATTAKTSSNSGVSWSASAFDLNYKTYLSTNAPVLGQYRAYRSDGTKVTLMAHNTDLYTVNDITGAITSIKSGLSGSASRYAFATANDIVYYVNGFDAPRKWDFTTEAVTPGSPAVSSLIISHKSRMFYVSAVDPTKIFFSNIADFETFTSTDFIYVPNPKSPDPIVKLAIINDNLYIFTRSTKWVLTGSDLTNMVLRKVPGSKGTKAPDTVQVFRNHAYFASDDGFYSFNGSTDTLLSEAITGEYQAAANKSSMAAVVYNNRYYVSYTPTGGGQNSRTWVYNLNYNSMESNDTATYVQRSHIWDGVADTGQFVQASNLVGALYYNELPSNTFNNLGKNLSWDIRTKYDHFGQPATNKHVKRWYPRFATAGNYPVLAQYDKDFASAPTTIPVSMLGAGLVYGSGALYGTGALYGSSSLINPRLTIPGLAKYVQLRYQRIGVNMPCEFEGSTVYYYIRRPR
jgi:hypothetical protein